MSDEPSQSVAAPEPTDVRFSTRALLIVTVAVALAASALGPYFRGLAPDKRAPVAAMWGVCWLFVLTWVGYHGRTRYQLERQAGRTILALSPRGRWIRNARPWLTILGGSLWVGLGLYYLVMAPEDFDRPQGFRSQMFSIVFRGLFSAMIITLGIVTIWWNQKVQLREHGVLRGLRLLRWSHITDRRWLGGGLFLEGVDQRHHDTRLAMNVPALQRGTVDALLAEKLPARFRPTVGELPGVEAMPVALPAIQITPKHELTVRRVTAVIAMYVVIFVIMLFRPWGAPPREFNIGAGIGCFGAIAALMFQQRRTGGAGAPIVRLATRIDWPWVTGATFVSLCCYYANQHLPFATPLVAAALGFGCGLGIFTIFGMIVRDKVDLCENGLVIAGWAVWPWSEIRLTKWNREGNGRLILHRGWRRVVATVSPKQREAVGAVLREKLGDKCSDEFATITSSDSRASARSREES